MAKRSVFIGLGVVVVLGAGALLAAVPVLENRANQAVDAFLMEVNREDGVKLTRVASRFDLWKRTAEIDGLSYEQTKNHGVKIDVPTLRVDGIGVMELVTHAFAAEAGQVDVLSSLRAFSAARIHAPTIVVEDRVTVPGKVSTSTYRDAVVTDVAQGIAGSIRIAAGEIEVPSKEENITMEPMSIGEIVYEGVDFGLYAALMIPGSERPEGMRPLIKAFRSAPMKLTAREHTADVTLLATLGGASSGEVRVDASKFDLEGLMAASRKLEEATRDEVAASPEDANDFVKAMGKAFSALEMDRLTLEGFAVVDAEKPDDKLSVGAITVSGLSGGRLKLLEVKDVETKFGENQFRIGRYGISDLDITGVIKSVDDDLLLKALAEEPLPTDLLVRLLPRGRYFLEGFDSVKDGLTTKIGRQHLALDGTSEGLPSRLSVSMEDFSLPLPEEDARFDALRMVGIETVAGNMALSISQDSAAATVTLESLLVDIKKLAAIDIKLALGKIDLTNFTATMTEEDNAKLLAAMTFIDGRLKLDNRDGRLETVMTRLAEEQGKDLEAFRAELAANAQMLGILFLGSSADAVVPALVKFIEEPKSITVSVRPKDAEMPAVELYTSLREGPQNIPLLLDLNATAQ